MKGKTDAVLAKMAATYELLAEQQVPTTLGRHVVEIIASGKPLSLDTLASSLEAEIETSKSARGTGDPGFDLLRIAAEKALVAITTNPSA